MDKLRKSRRHYTRKCGAQVPDMVADLLAQRHPTVSILWERQIERWCLVQIQNGETHLIAILGDQSRYEAPTISNTVYYLDKIHPSKIRSEFAKQKFLEGLDRSDEMKGVQKRAGEQISDGSKDLFNALTNRKILTIRK